MATAKKKTPATNKKPTPAKKKPKSSKGGPRGIDWYQLRKEYLSDNTVTYADLAKKYKVSKTTIGNRAIKEKWTELRQDLNESAYNEFKQNLLDEKSNAQSRHLQHWRNLQALANNSIQDMADRLYYTDKAGNLILDKNDKPIPRPINTFELEKLAKSLKIAIDGERVVLGIPTSVSALSDPEGDSVWSGLADLIKGADEVLKEHGESVE